MLTARHGNCKTGRHALVVLVAGLATAGRIEQDLTPPDLHSAGSVPSREVSGAEGEGVQELLRAALLPGKQNRLWMGG